MLTKDEISAYESKIRFLERQTKILEETLLDQLAVAALASGRYAATQVYDIAHTALMERKNHVR